MDGAFAGGLGLFFIVAMVVLFLGALGFWIWSIIDCATKESDTGNNKLVWILVILFGGIIGTIVYVLARRPKRFAELGR